MSRRSSSYYCLEVVICRYSLEPPVVQRYHSPRNEVRLDHLRPDASARPQIRHSLFPSLPLPTVQTSRIFGHLGYSPDRIWPITQLLGKGAEQNDSFYLSPTMADSLKEDIASRINLVDTGVLAPKIWAYENTISRYVSVVCDASKVPMRANVNSSI
ncbi:hypothetical protein BTUL_0101g00320 [Botrytis tulipae]|uniref:Uncharacterized protein n=1 Tax=Botrytis tulipae TaxID=87230 RepID=A0A4Z1EK11_9HELO|nr:hypothetical protein BTUL_0101g00320 [Botrytis tulipae]